MRAREDWLKSNPSRRTINSSLTRPKCRLLARNQRFKSAPTENVSTTRNKFCIQLPPPSRGQFSAATPKAHSASKVLWRLLLSRTEAPDTCEKRVRVSVAGEQNFLSPLPPSCWL